MNTTEFCKANNITIEVNQVDNNPNMSDDGYKMDHWKVTMKRGKKRMTTYFSKGYGHNGAEPEVDEVIDCLASDSSGVENARNFEDFAHEFGYDTDSRKAEKIYTTCLKQSAKFKVFLGDDLYDEILWHVERD